MKTELCGYLKLCLRLICPAAPPPASVFRSRRRLRCPGARGPGEMAARPARAALGGRRRPPGDAVGENPYLPKLFREARAPGADHGTAGLYEPPPFRQGQCAPGGTGPGPSPRRCKRPGCAGARPSRPVYTACPSRWPGKSRVYPADVRRVSQRGALRPLRGCPALACAVYLLVRRNTPSQGSPGGTGGVALNRSQRAMKARDGVTLASGTSSSVSARAKPSRAASQRMAR